MAAAIQIPSVFTAKDKYSKIISRMQKHTKKFSDKTVAYIKRIDNKISKTYKKMSKLGKLALGLGIATIFTLAIQNNIAYEDSLASVSSITGATGKELAKLEMMSKKTAKSQRMLGADVLKAYELIGSAKPELLQNTKLLDEVTNAAVTLSKAGRMELAPAAEALTTTLNQFGLGGEHAQKVIDHLAAGAKFGSSSITDTSVALSKFGSIAASTGTKVNESIALIELVSPFEKGAEAGTKLRNILGKIAGTKILSAEAKKTLKRLGVDLDIVSDSSLSLGVRLKEMSKLGKDSTAVMQVFGTENAALAQSLFNNIDGYDSMLESINQVGVANDQASTNTNTLKFALDSIMKSFLNTTTATNSNNKVLEMLKSILFGVADNMDIVVSILGTLLVLYGVFKTVLWLSQAALLAKNIALAANVALGNKSIMALRGNIAAQNAYKIAMAAGTAFTWLATAATTAFGVALNLGLWPILLIIAAVAAIIAIFMNWSSIVDWFGKQWKRFTGFLGATWDRLTKFFKEFDFKQMFINIGKSIINFMLMPLRWVLKLLSYLPGRVGNMAEGALKKLDEFTGNVDVKNEVVDKTKKEPEKVLPSTTQASNEVVTKTITENNANVGLTIKDQGNNVEEVENNDGIPIKVTNTVGSF